MRQPCAASAAGSSLLAFDIPAQPLGAALDWFALVSGRSALFPGALVEGRSSAPVRGCYTAKVALQRLLEGTGLGADEIRSGRLSALVLKPSDAPVSFPAEPATTGLADYEGLMQAGIWQALCADPDAAADNYRSLLRFQVDSAGRVRQPRLLSSTDDPRRDQALLDVLQHVEFDRAPPPQLAQPVTMLILPKQEGGPVCTTSRGER